MLKEIAVYSYNYMKPINTCCGQNPELLNVKQMVHVVNTVIFKLF
jgi:hypothetical protein